jgi:predicted  nucleic acid-binding Zn-ribbon protein
MDENLETRISALERWRTIIEVSLGKQEVDREYINKRFDAIEEELKGIKSTFKNLNYTVWCAIVVIFVKFAFSGQLATFI